MVEKEKQSQGSVSPKAAPCNMCGALIQYTGRKPAKCDLCKKAEATVRKRKPRPKKVGSSKEMQMFSLMDKLLPGQYYIRNGYYSFLQSPKGSPMQYDLYYPEFKLAMEFDGKQHNEYNPYFFKTKKQFEYLQECDKLKDRYSSAFSITLIRITHDKKITVSLIKERLTAAGRLDIIKMMEGK